MTAEPAEMSLPALGSAEAALRGLSAVLHASGDPGRVAQAVAAEAVRRAGATHAVVLAPLPGVGTAVLAARGPSGPTPFSAVADPALLSLVPPVRTRLTVQRRSADSRVLGGCPVVLVVALGPLQGGCSVLLGLVAVPGPELLGELAELGTGPGTALSVAVLLATAQQEARTDPLTGLANRRQLDRTLAVELERHRRYGGGLGVVLVDLDHFKRVNDTFGHAAGDQVLAEVAARVSGCVREVDLVARFGGEELGIVLPETELAGTQRTAERIRRQVSETPIECSGRPLRLSVSAGAAVCPAHGEDAAELLRSADVALYAAKRSGRNQVRVAGAEVAPRLGRRLVRRPR